MKILIAGGSGFIGSHLCKALVDKGELVVCVDNLITGHEKNIEELKKKENFTFVKADVCNEQMDFGKIDQIYHLASPASPAVDNPRGYHALWEETMKVNTIGTWNLVNLALKNDAKFLYTSTSEVYGDPLEHPQKESYRGNVSTVGPRSVYDEAKRFGETIVAAYTKNKGLDGRIIRIFNTYGPNMDLDEGRVVYNLAKAALRNEPIPIYGSGEQTRSFCFVSDLILGLIKAMNGQMTKGEVINLGNPREFTIIELAKMVIQKTGSKSEFKYFPLPTDDPAKRKPDITKAKELLGWEPKVELSEGLDQTINYIKENL